MKINSRDRRISGLVEFLVFEFFFMLPIVAVSATNIPDCLDRVLSYAYYTGFGCFLAKDIFRGASFVKQIYGIKIVDNEKETAVGKIRTVLRNSTLILLFPVEFAVVFFSPSRRIGDLIFNTKLVSTEKVGIGTQLKRFHWSVIDKRTLIAFIIALVIGFTLLLTINTLIQLL